MMICSAAATAQSRAASTNGWAEQAPFSSVASPVETATRICSGSPPAPRAAPWVACCMATAQAMALAALSKRSITPSPVVFTSLQLCFVTAPRSAVKCAWRCASYASCPRRLASSAEPTRSVKTTVTVSVRTIRYGSTRSNRLETEPAGGACLVADSVAWLHRFYHAERPFLLLAPAPRDAAPDYGEWMPSDYRSNLNRFVEFAPDIFAAESAKLSPAKRGRGGQFQNSSVKSAAEECERGT